jgi:ubiquitin-protein ligase E3 A
MTFKGFVLSHFYPGPINDKSVVFALKLLGILFETNQISKIVPISEFYIPEISQSLNFKEECKHWKGSQGSSKFSFFKYPFIFDPISKTRIMHIDALFKMSLEFEDAYVSQALVFQAQKFLEHNEQLSALNEKMQTAANLFLVLEIRRESLIEDTIDQLRKKFADLKKAIKVKFIDGGEVGMDQGGVQKEYFQLIISKLLDVSYGLFVYDDQTRYNWFNSDSINSDVYFELVGILIGLAVYNGVMLGFSFPQIFYKKILDEKVGFDDFIQAFPQLGKGLEQLLLWEDGDVEDIFQRSFEISYQHLGVIKSKPLIPNGENIPVTNKNRKGKQQYFFII